MEVMEVEISDWVYQDTEINTYKCGQPCKYNIVFSLLVHLFQLAPDIGRFFRNIYYYPKKFFSYTFSFVANLSKSIQMQAGKKLKAEDVTRFSEWAPKFMWLFRDVTLEPTDKKGKPCHVKDFLLQKVSNSNGLDIISICHLPLHSVVPA